jgi:fatty-acyl-CoA synthase
VKGLMQAFPLTLDLVLRRALELGGGTDVVSAGPSGVVRHTWRQVAERALRLGSALDELGVPRGGVVATFAWNSHRHVELMLGVPCSGRTVHPVNVRLWPEDSIRLMARTGDAALFVDASLTGLLAPLLERLPMSRIVVMDDGAEADPSFAAAPRYEALIAASSNAPGPPAAGAAEDDAAWICHTSGTTGDPKGVVASHRSAVLHSFSSMTADSHAISSRDTVLPVTPIFHANAWGLPYTTALAVSRLVLPGRDTSAAALARLIDAERVTVAAGVPTVFDRLLADAGTASAWPSLRRILCGGAPVPTALARRFADRGIEVFQGWGMTEMLPSGSANIVRGAGGLASATDVEGEGSILRAGKATAGVELRVVADDGRIQPWDGSSVGEVEARGPWVIRAYLNPDDDANTSRFDDGWLRTGDLGRMAPDGTLEIVDRVKDLVKSGGEWISSLTLERALLLHPSVAHAAVVAMPDERWGERPAAFVVAADEPPDPDELRRFLAERVPRWWVPDDIRLVERLPLTPVGKYDKRRLRDELAGHAVESAERDRSSAGP